MSCGGQVIETAKLRRFLQELKIGIVGPEEPKWTEEQKAEAKMIINQIFNAADCNINQQNKNFIYTDIVLVSGRCPVGWCTHCQKRVMVPNDAPLDGFTTCPKCGYLTLRRTGGVDIWAEEIANKLGVKTEIYPAPAKQWKDIEITVVQPETILKGYRSRNIQIAEACYILYCIVPKKLSAFCGHHQLNKIDYRPVGEGQRYDEWFQLNKGHPRNGGCWTLQYAKEKLRKETHLVVVECKKLK